MLAVLLALAAAAADPAPVAVPLEERVEKRLAQLDVVVEGNPDVIRSLTEKDFRLAIGGKNIERFTLDPSCLEWSPAPEQASTESGASPAPVAAHPGAAVGPAFLFYFDQPHLTPGGRMRAVKVARDLVGRLVVEGARAAVVSSGRSLKTIVPLTDDVGVIVRGIESIETDASLWDTYAATEDSRLDEIKWEIRAGNLAGARSLARRYAQDDAWQARLSYQRMGIAFGVLAGAAPPRSVVYFGDTLRQGAGQFYLDFVGDNGDVESSWFFDFSRFVVDALGQGVHMYPVQAEGIGQAGRRTFDAEAGMWAMALETGGDAFIRGMQAKKIVPRIAAKVRCTYLFSFDPRDLPADKSLRVEVASTRSGVKVRAQGQFVVQSESTKKMRGMLAAFVRGEGDDPQSTFAAFAIPLAMKDGRYRMLVQIRAPSSPTPGAEWDLGASLVSRGSHGDDFSARVSTNGAAIPIVLEHEVWLDPGPFEIVAVGRSVKDETVHSARIEGELGNLKKGTTMSPVLILQESTAAFSRDGATRTSGSLALGPKDAVSNQKPAALISLVCLDKKTRSVAIERRVTGERTLEFPVLEVDRAEACTQIRDVIPAELLAPGTFAYEVVVKGEGKEPQSVRREFAVVR